MSTVTTKISVDCPTLRFNARVGTKVKFDLTGGACYVALVRTSAVASVVRNYANGKEVKFLTGRFTSKTPVILTAPEAGDLTAVVLYRIGFSGTAKINIL